MSLSLSGRLSIEDSNYNKQETLQKVIDTINNTDYNNPINQSIVWMQSNENLLKSLSVDFMRCVQCKDLIGILNTELVRILEDNTCFDFREILISAYSLEMDIDEMSYSQSIKLLLILKNSEFIKTFKKENSLLISSLDNLLDIINENNYIELIKEINLQL